MRKYVYVWCDGEIVLLVTKTYVEAVDFVLKYAKEKGYKNLFCARVEYKNF